MLPKLQLFYSSAVLLYLKNAGHPVAASVPDEPSSSMLPCGKPSQNVNRPDAASTVPDEPPLLTLPQASTEQKSMPASSQQGVPLRMFEYFLAKS